MTLLETAIVEDDSLLPIGGVYETYLYAVGAGGFVSLVVQAVLNKKRRN